MDKEELENLENRCSHLEELYHIGKYTYVCVCNKYPSEYTYTKGIITGKIIPKTYVNRRCLKKAHLCLVNPDIKIIYKNITNQRIEQRINLTNNEILKNFKNRCGHLEEIYNNGKYTYTCTCKKYPSEYISTSNNVEGTIIPRTYINQYCLENAHECEVNPDRGTIFAEPLSALSRIMNNMQLEVGGVSTQIESNIINQSQAPISNNTSTINSKRTTDNNTDSSNCIYYECNYNGNAELFACKSEYCTDEYFKTGTIIRNHTSWTNKYCQKGGKYTRYNKMKKIEENISCMHYI